VDTAYMREVIGLAKHLNFKSAAAELYISQPTLTRHLNAVEEELGVTLFDRGKHGVEITRCGSIAVKAFEKILATYAELEEEVGQVAETAGDLRFGMIYYGAAAYYGYPLLEAFSKQHPEIRVSTITAQSVQLYRYLHQGVIDVGLTVTAASYGSEIERATVATIPLYAFVENEHPLAQRESVSLEELAAQTVILNMIPSKEQHFILELFGRHGLRPANTVYMDHIDMLLPTLAHTGGVFIGSMLLTAIPQQHHAFVPIEASDFTIDVALVYLKENENRAIQQLIDCVGDIRKPVM